MPTTKHQLECIQQLEAYEAQIIGARQHNQDAQMIIDHVQEFADQHVVRPDLRPRRLVNNARRLQRLQSSIDLLEALRQPDGDDHDQDVCAAPTNDGDRVHPLRFQINAPA